MEPLTFTKKKYFYEVCDNTFGNLENVYFAIWKEDMWCGALSSFLIAVAQMAISCKTGSPQLFIIHPPLPMHPIKLGDIAQWR